MDRCATAAAVVVAAGVEAAAAGVVATAAGVVADGVVARGVGVAPVVAVAAVVVAGAGVTGTVVVGTGEEDDGAGDASGGRDAASAAGGGALRPVGAEADFGSAPAGFEGAMVRAARSDTGRVGTVAAGREGDEFAGTRDGDEFVEARAGGELDGVDGGRPVAVLLEVAAEGDGFAGLAVRSCFAADGPSLEAVTFGGGTAFGGTTTSVTGRGDGTVTSVIGVGLVASGFSTGAAGGGAAAAISERVT